jgi:molybdenum cofactor cytidylyltransferase
MLERVLETLRESRVDETVVVLGESADEIRRKVKLRDERIIVNNDHGAGMSGSLNLGLRSLDGEVDAVLIVLGDQPFVSPSTIDKIIDAYSASKAPIVLPVYHGKRGNPVLFDRSLFPRIMSITGDVGAKSVVDENGEKLMAVEVDDEGVTIDIDTPSEYQGARGGRIPRPRKSPEAA